MAAAQPPSRDPERTLDLLWGTREAPRRGPRGSLSVGRIVEKAVEIADADGLEAVTMRRVAEQLDVTTMSLYRYVPGKDDLCELMSDHASPPPETGDWPEEWRPRLHAYAQAMRDLYRARPWMLDISISGPPLGPNTLAWTEVGLAALDGSGLSEQDMVTALSLISGYVRYDAILELGLVRAEPRTGVTPEQWGAAYSQALGRVVKDSRFPTLARIVQKETFSGAGSLDDDFEAGLHCVLEGVAALMRGR